MIDLVSSWSKERHPLSLNYRKPFAVKPTVTTKEYMTAYKWLKDSKRDTLGADDEYYTRSSDSTSTQLLTLNDVQNYKKTVESLTFKNFDAYHNLVNGIRYTRLNRTDFLASQCTCPEYFKSNVCKHILGMAAVAKINPIPNEAKGSALEIKPRRGRPAKAKKALVRQTVEKANGEKPTTSKAVMESSPIKSQPKKRGRRIRVATDDSDSDQIDENAKPGSSEAAEGSGTAKKPPKKRGRPAKIKKIASEAETEPEMVAPVSKILIVKKSNLRNK